LLLPVLIPAYRPDSHLIDLVNELNESGINDIIIVDDGSGSEYEDIFSSLAENTNCHICTHAVNLGKGRAIKTGLNFAITSYRDILGVITADSDGQHLPRDIIKVHKKLIENPGDLILGCRNFDRNVPFRSKIGNEVTKIVFHLLIGMKVSDTQTGLRGIPARYIPVCLKMDGEKYDFEINMLASCRRNEIAIKETPIETVYIDQNRSSLFNPVFDSIKIYFVLLRFLISSLSTSFIDFVVFIICTSFGANILISTISARLVAGNYNFIINKKIVFKSHTNAIVSFIKYWSLVALLGTLSYLGITALNNYADLNLLFSKAILETLLFFVSFAVQRDLIFYSSEDSK
jgi:glycosyltransferase involved in cell wall biosynthesis